LFILGHTGITLKAAHRMRSDVNLRVAALIALYPDIIDKFLNYIYCPLFAPDWTHGLTRTVGHSLTINALVMLNLGLWAWRTRHTHPDRWVYAAIIPIHLILDEMWDPALRVTLMWPWLGNDFPRIFDDNVASHLARNFSKIEVVLGEVLGAILLWDLRSAIKAPGAEQGHVGVAGQGHDEAPAQAEGVAGEALYEGHHRAAHDGRAEDAGALGRQGAQAADGHGEDGGEHHRVEEADGEHSHHSDSP
jgi:hypothetical protein